MSSAQPLLATRRGSLVAAAGCGKTQLIAQAVQEDSSRTSLVLTHTHAGVDALRRRLGSLGVPWGACRVDTIAGWCLRLSRAFPATSSIDSGRPTEQEWAAVYAAAASLLRIPALSTVIRASYETVYVDEYQDCTRDQHSVILALAELLPTHVLGDPLQAIFGFAGTSLVDWPTDVEPAFPPLEPLTTPHRWLSKNPALGGWLVDVREALTRGSPVDLSTAPTGAVTFVRLPGDPRGDASARVRICSQTTCPPSETLVAVRGWEGQCHRMAQDTGGKFHSLEKMDCPELFEYAARFDAATTGHELAASVLDFACLCLTQIKSAIGKTAGRLIMGEDLQRGRRYKHGVALQAIVDVVREGTLTSARRALLVLARSCGAAPVRRELYREMLAALAEYEAGQHPTLEDAAVRSRDRTRRLGRPPARYVVGRTLLIKGLEFDHALVIDAEALKQKDLYVALTRASRTLTVLARAPILSPSAS